MNSLFQRLIIVAATAVLAVSATPVAPAAATATMDANYTCASGDRFRLSDLVGYIIIAGMCTGSGSGTYGTITIPSGSYFCQFVRYNPTIGLLNAQGC